MSLLTPDPGLLFWMLLSFGIVVFVLTRYGFPVILKMVNERKSYIDQSLREAKQAHEELEKVKENSEALLEQTHKKQSEILADAGKTRTQMIEKAKNEAKIEADKIVADARKRIQAEKDAALREVRAEVASLSVDIAEKILRENLDTPEKQMSMIDRLMEEMKISKS